MLSLYLKSAWRAFIRQRDVSAASASGKPLALSLPVIVGIALGGALIILSILLVILIRRVRKTDHLERQRIATEIQDREEQVEFKASIQYAQPLELNPPKQLSGNSFEPFGDTADEFVEINLDTPPKTRTTDFGHCSKAKSPPKLRYRYSNSPPKPKVKRSSGQGGGFHYSGIRDSWPLVSGMPLPFLPSQSQSAMILNQVAPPGYIVAPESDSKWLRRSSSKVMKNKVIVLMEEPGDGVKPPSSTKGSKWHNPQCRSNSETELSSILRSTSQRLRAAHRLSLTHTMSTLVQLPGPPPSQRPPTPPSKKQAKSREALIDNEVSYAESEHSSVFESYMRRTPSSEKLSKNSEYAERKCDRSKSHSGNSVDSFCGPRAPDLVLPVPLASSSKRYTARDQRHTMNISKNPKELSLPLRKNSPKSIWSPVSRNSMVEAKKASSASLNRISLLSDPFYSEVKSLEPVFSTVHVQAPRPLYARKATFDQYGASIKSLSSTSPLQDVSGNTQPVPPKHNPWLASLPMNETDDSLERNLSPWDPKKTMRIQPEPQSPKHHASQKQDHKRSNIVRMPNLSRSQNAISANVVPEEYEDEPFPLKLSIPSGLPIHVMEPEKSPSPSPSTTSRRHSMRPPSTSAFKPSCTSLDLRHNSSNRLLECITKESQQIQPPDLSVKNCLTEQPSSLEDEFQSRSSTTASLAHSRTTSQCHNRKTSEPRTLTSFSTPVINPRSISISAQPSSTSHTIISPPPLSHFQPPSPVPPIFTMPIPGHLIGPRSLPTRFNSSTSPSRNSLRASIGLLRRMNSEGSHYSNTYLASDIYSPISSSIESPELSAYRSSALSPYPRLLNLSSDGYGEDKESGSRGRGYGSQYYLSIDQRESPQYQWNHCAPGKRNSHLLYERGGQRKIEELEHVIEDPDELTAAREVSSPSSTVLTLGHIPTIRWASNLCIVSSPPKSNFNSPVQASLPPTNLHLSLNAYAPTASTSTLPPQKPKYVRWSDAIPSTAATSAGRESKLEHLSPRTPPRGLGISFYDGQPGSGPNGEMRIGTGDSLELYDKNGFLKNSPVKEESLMGKEEKEVSVVL
ncbi:hypothetical protein BGZ60DRAFT_434958 [Tricladium varicosporioides]|nr:hypothetical protein BGZ60DRAFT_434958 [Hymenoscyphus varicosporioides]